MVLGVPGTTSAYSERVAGGRYIDITPDRVAAARFGLNIDDLSQVIAPRSAGINITQTVEGLERYPVNLRFPRERRDSVEKLRALPLVTPTGAQIPLAQVAETGSPTAHRCSRAKTAALNGWTFVDIRDVDLGSYVAQAQQAVREQVQLPAGYSDRLVRPVRIHAARERPSGTGSATDAGDHLRPAVPDLPSCRPGADGDGLVAVCAGRWLLADILLDFHLSVAVGVGFHRAGRGGSGIGVVMLVYLDNAARPCTAGAADAPRSCARRSWRARCCR